MDSTVNSNSNSKAVIRAMSITTDGLMKLRVTSSKYAPVLSELNNDNMRVYLIKEERKIRVNFTVESIERSIMVLQLDF